MLWLLLFLARMSSVSQWSLALFKYFCNEELRSGVPDSVTNGSVCARLHTHTQTDFKRMPDACSVSFNSAPQLSSTGRLVPMADQLVAAQRPSSAQLADQRRRCLVPFQACSHVQGVLEPGIPGAIWSASASAGVQRKPIRCLFTAATVAASYTPPEPK